MADSLRRRTVVHLGLVSLAGVAALCAVADVDSPLRVVVGVLCAFFLPGAAALVWLDLDNFAAWLGLAAGVSLAIEALVASAALWFGMWHPAAINLGLGLVAAAVLLLDVRRRSRAAREPRL